MTDNVDENFKVVIVISEETTYEATRREQETENICGHRHFPQDRDEEVDIITARNFSSPTSHHLTRDFPKEGNNEKADKSSTVDDNLKETMISNNSIKSTDTFEVEKASSWCQEVTEIVPGPLQPEDLFPHPPIKRHTPLENGDKVVRYKNGVAITLSDCFDKFSRYLDKMND